MDWRKVVRSDGYLFWSSAIPIGLTLMFIVYMIHDIETHMDEIIERAHGNPPHAVTTANVLMITLNAAWFASNLIFRRMNKEIDALNRKRSKEMDERVMRGEFVDKVCGPCARDLVEVKLSAKLASARKR